jgi:hypothetical protein
MVEAVVLYLIQPVTSTVMLVVVELGGMPVTVVMALEAPVVVTVQLLHQVLEAAEEEVHVVQVVLLEEAEAEELDFSVKDVTVLVEIIAHHHMVVAVLAEPMEAPEELIPVEAGVDMEEEVVLQDDAEVEHPGV